MGASGKTYAVPRGMRDFYPADMQRRRVIFEAWSAAADRFGFEPYDSCVVETLDLLKRKGGEEIEDQIYAFQDKSGRELALRPEMTPTLARMVAARQGRLVFPLKWCTIAQCFRYERSTRGRKREHYQWNLDVIGEPGISAEAEVIATAIHALRSLGLRDEHFQVRMNSRALLSELFRATDIPEALDAAVFLALDKRGKVDDLSGVLAESGLSPEQIDTALGLTELTTLDEVTARVGEDSVAAQDLLALFELLERYGVRDAVTFDLSVIRGLGYYTGIVFEAFDRTAGLRAIFGGGRYDNLLAAVGGKPMTAVGLGFGDVVIDELLQELDITPPGAQSERTAVGYMRAEQQLPAVTIARELRESGRAVELGLRPEKPKAFFSRVGNGGYSNAVFIGPDDVEKGVYRLKDLGTREETERALPTHA